MAAAVVALLLSPGAARADALELRGGGGLEWASARRGRLALAAEGGVGDVLAVRAEAGGEFVGPAPGRGDGFAALGIVAAYDVWTYVPALSLLGGVGMAPLRGQVTLRAEVRRYVSRRGLVSVGGGVLWEPGAWRGLAGLWTLWSID